MPEQKVWCWEAELAGLGPDWRFVAYVTPPSEAALAERAERAALPGYTACGPATYYCASHRRACPRHALVDSANAQAYIDNVAGKSPRNLWVYNIIEIHGDMIEVESGYGGRGATYNLAETLLLLELFAPPAIAVRHWAVAAGGDGYEFRTLSQGPDADTLRAYLQ